MKYEEDVEWVSEVTAINNVKICYIFLKRSLLANYVNALLHIHCQYLRTWNYSLQLSDWWDGTRPPDKPTYFKKHPA